MTRSLMFWILMCLWLLFGFVGYFDVYPDGRRFVSFGNDLLLFVLLLLLGWDVYGAAIKGKSSG